MSYDPFGMPTNPADLVTHMGRRPRAFRTVGDPAGDERDYNERHGNGPGPSYDLTQFGDNRHGGQADDDAN